MCNISADVFQQTVRQVLLYFFSSKIPLVVIALGSVEGGKRKEELQCTR